MLRRSDLYEQGEVAWHSRKEITQERGLADAAVSRISRELVDHGLVGEEPDPSSNRRPGRRHPAPDLRNGGYVFALCLTVGQESYPAQSLWRTGRLQ